MVDSDDDSFKKEELSPRIPTLDDLLQLCTWLNDRGSKYIVIGGLAMVRLGFTRATEDIDLLIENSQKNEAAVIDAISQLEDHAAREIQPGEVAEYEVIRVADELIVDLMGKACGLTYGEAESQIDWQEIKGVKIPFASAELMLRLKQSVRDKDRMDREFLISLLKR